MRVAVEVCRVGVGQEVQGVVSRNALRELLGLMRPYFGPAAKLILKHEFTERGLSANAVPRQVFRELVASMATRIPSEDRRMSFVSEAMTVERM